MLGDRHQLLGERAALGGEVDGDSALVVRTAAPRHQALALHLADQAGERRDFDGGLRCEIAEPLIAGLPQRGQHPIHGEADAVGSDAPDEQFAHAHADSIEQVGKGFRQAIQAIASFRWSTRRAA